MVSNAPAWPAYLKRDLDAAARVHVASDFEARQVARLKPGAPLFVQGFGLDARHAARERSRAAASRSRPRLGGRRAAGACSSGRIQAGKGLETLVPALAAMKDAGRRWRSPGRTKRRYRHRVEALVAAHGVGGRVRFVGMIGGDEKREALTDADALAAPSAHENFGIAVRRGDRPRHGGGRLRPGRPRGRHRRE